MNGPEQDTKHTDNGPGDAPPGHYRMRLTYSSHGRFAAIIRESGSERKIAQTAWFDTREEATRMGEALLEQLLHDSDS